MPDQSSATIHSIWACGELLDDRWRWSYKTWMLSSSGIGKDKTVRSKSFLDTRPVKPEGELSAIRICEKDNLDGLVSRFVSS